MSITRSDEGAENGISKMGVGLGPREGSDRGRTSDWMGGDWTGGIEWGVGLEGSDWGSDWGVGLEGSDWGGQTGGVRLGG